MLAGVPVRRLIPTIERRARAAVRHRMVAAERTDDVGLIAEGLVALHSSDPVTVYLSAAARMPEPALAPVEQALYERRNLLRHHAMRRTLWVLGHEAARHAHHAATVGLVVAQRKLLFDGLTGAGVADPEAWTGAAADRVLALLRELGPCTAREIGAQLPELATPIMVGTGKTKAQLSAHTRLLLVLGFEGRVLRARPTGTWINGQYRWAAADSWSPPGLGEPLDKRAAAAGLARRWLRAFGPGTRDDLRWWAGWTVATTTAALADVEAVEVDLEGGGVGYVLSDDVEPAAEAPPAALLLPGLDPSTMGWKERAFYLDPAHVPEMFDRNGNGGPAAWVDGRIVGGWAQRKDGTIAMKLLADVGADRRAELEAAAHTLEKLLGEVRFTVRFPAPMQAELLS